MTVGIGGTEFEKNLSSKMGLQFYELSYASGLGQPCWPYFEDMKIDRLHAMALRFPAGCQCVNTCAKPAAKRSRTSRSGSPATPCNPEGRDLQHGECRRRTRQNSRPACHLRHLSTALDQGLRLHHPLRCHRRPKSPIPDRTGSRCMNEARFVTRSASVWRPRSAHEGPARFRRTSSPGAGMSCRTCCLAPDLKGSYPLHGLNETRTIR